MVFASIQQAAFVPVEPYELTFHTLAFPDEWEAPILDLFTHGRSEESRRKTRQIPIGRLNALVRAVAPDIVSVGKKAQFGVGRPWAYATRPFPSAVARTLINTWLYDLPSKPEGKALVGSVIKTLDLDSLEWQTSTVDLLAKIGSEGGTALPSEHLYHLLPEVLAARVAAHRPYQHNGAYIQFKQIAVNPADGYAELMSWPPLPYTDEASRTWYYSATIKIALRTVPFHDTPRIYIHTGVRRWAGSPLNTKGTNAASTYLLTSNPLIGGAPQPGRFAVAQLQWSPRTGGMVWRYGGAEEMLSRVSAISHLPSSELIAGKPDAWLFGRDGLEAAVAYHTTMRSETHKVGAGIMPEERRRLTEWVAEALAPEFEMTAPLQRVRGRHTPQRVLEAKVSVPGDKKKDLTDEEQLDLELRRTEANKQNIEILLRNAQTRRARLADAVPADGLSVFLLYQDPGMRDRLLNAVEERLALTDRQVVGEESWLWRTNTLQVRVHASQLGDIGAPLGGDTKPAKGDQHDAAIAQRRAQVHARLSKITGRTGDTAQLVLIELEGRDAFRIRTTDPKFAIRMGCADAGMVSQFIQPHQAPRGRAADNNDHRAEAAWEDGFRQLGMRFLPQPSVTETIPDQLNQLAFWVVKRQKDDTNSHPLFIPIAILIRPGQSHVMGKTADMPDWVPYPQLLQHLAGNTRPNSARTVEQQTSELAAFVRRTIYRFRNTPTLIMAHAHNIRYRWPWLLNSNLVADTLQFGEGQLQGLAFHDKNWRFVRICTNERIETSQWWGPNQDQAAGIAKGLWSLDSDPATARIFYSTVEKPGTHATVRTDLAKFTPHYAQAKKKAGKSAEVAAGENLSDDNQAAEGQEPRNTFDPSQTAWNPELLEIALVGLQSGDRTISWASFVHQQRLCDDDYKASLALPLIMHLASLVDRYALPGEDNEDDAEAELPASSEEKDVQLELDFGF